MRIGVVSEGATDFIAIKEFAGGFLSHCGHEASFVQLQPSPDRTDDGGWTRVVFWLEENPPAARIARFFGGGLFNNGLDNLSCDALIIHIDTDILGDEIFSNFMRNRGINFDVPRTPQERSDEVCRILIHFSDLNTLTFVDRNKHVFFPAVESSENWCVAAFERVSYDPETLSGQNLWNAFGIVLLRSEGTTEFPLKFGPPDKQVVRRDRFCKRHRSSQYVYQQSQQFKRGCDELLILAGNSV